MSADRPAPGDSTSGGKRMWRWAFVVMAACAVTVAVAGAMAVLPASDRPNADDELATALEWARLEPLPPSATDVEVEADGTPLTRSFMVTFSAPPGDVERWLDRSPGTAGAVITDEPPLRRYAITPGGGAQFAEVEYDVDSGEVRVRTYWS